jgi:RNA polymerase sigma-70 factor, ECF subfamily
MSISDGALIDMAGADEVFAGGLYAEHGPAVLAYVRHLGARHHDAEDIVQETIVRAWRHAADLDPARGTIRGWLFTVARNILIDRSRPKSATPAGMDPPGPAPQTGPDWSAVVVERTYCVNALARLSPEHRSAIIGVYYRDRTIDAAARSLGVPPGTVKSRLYYGLRNLRAIFEADGFDH